MVTGIYFLFAAGLVLVAYLTIHRFMTTQATAAVAVRSPGIYVSGDELERAFAYDVGYRDICAHPREIGVPKTTETFVIDFDHVLFDDKDAAVMKANGAANRGVLVGIHTYYPTDPRLGWCRSFPNVVIAKTHRRVLAHLRRLVARRKLQPQGDRRRPQTQESVVSNGQSSVAKAGGTPGATARGQ